MSEPKCEHSNPAWHCGECMAIEEIQREDDEREDRRRQENREMDKFYHEHPHG